MSALIWFRRDLRVRDNTALHYAAKEFDQVIGLFTITPRQWQKHDDAPVKINFWMENLQCLADELDALNIPLLIRYCDTFAEVPQKIVDVIADFNCEKLFFNREYEVNELVRDSETVEALEARGVESESFHDRIIVPPRDIATKDGRFYSVFTPYRKVWDTKALNHARTLPKPKPCKPPKIKADSIPKSVDGFDFSLVRSDLWKPGEAEAKKRLKKFASHIDGYNQWRDIPSTAGTSFLSPYLAAGVISPRQCLAAAIRKNGGELSGSEGSTTWVSELTWRDFYTHVMVGFPKVSKHQPFKDKTNGVPWRHDSDDFEAWCEGRTGYPIVDAGMRQLNQTGWMHNRMRMVTAMFLTKNLLIDWRWGEEYFMKHLVDGDLAANNGGWQWSASTGTDAVPYFRIFSPFSQSKRFDVDGKYIKKFCPELEALPSKAFHDEKKLADAIGRHATDYPGYIVDYKASRQRALEAFKLL
jgi:deoxyribodipyrimidine photo-lyase